MTGVCGNCGYAPKCKDCGVALDVRNRCGRCRTCRIHAINARPEMIFTRLENLAGARHGRGIRGVPANRVDEYRMLTRVKKIPAAQAREIIAASPART